MDNKSKNSFVGILSEASIVIILVILILSTLNYFRILPLSDTFSFLSFLPSQNQSSSKVRPAGNPPDLSFSSLAVVGSDKPQKFTNSKEEESYKYIEKSFLIVNKGFRADFELSTDNKTSASGINFSNGEKFKDSKYRSISIVRYAKDKGSWLLSSTNGDKSSFTYLFKTTPGVEFKKFTLILAEDGKSVSVISPGIPLMTINLEASFFASQKQVSASINVAPGSEVTIYSLYYQY